jgi:hypothetical protein
VQVAAYVVIGMIVLGLKTKELLLWEKERSCSSQRPFTWSEILVLGLRLELGWVMETAGLVFGALAVRGYRELGVLAVLPVSGLATLLIIERVLMTWMSRFSS